MASRARRPQESRYFPDPREAGEDGFVGVGGELDPDWLLDAYAHGIFPWPSSDEEPLLWWSLDPRAILPLDGLYISRRLGRSLRSGRYRVTANQDFAGVMRGCAEGPGRAGGTWITPAMRAAYQELHRLGSAHSVETWDDDRLVGGIYGVAIGGLFAGESMFHRSNDASKVALATLVAHLGQRGYRLLDVQQSTPHTARMGAVEIRRSEYLDRLAEAVQLPVSFGTLEITPEHWR
ncbi:leucyl/phenylalanyl-tRNA--protein transferase [Botrimarina hoheduenensis]|uniref:Leucyl/phenylalanyl-tRNA--protein transferase n=1 Tax=Botrimarina hoheduenensis TaxID=2528000 RepID=A0A5C5WG37_9BACT|nr:leucyl/phenylalanyl-tRNA--protein transferase [Botrimarina hoheduenensis]TWT48742.1 Leucyl/phenylalanyl-tRNA--protein transferase [Botrimarina hoheduenensis]